MRPIYFASRVMKDAERRYIDVEKMVLALMYATQQFRPYLLPKHFLVLTMEETFPYVLQHMDVSSCISKWIVRLQEFDYSTMVEESTRASLADILTHRYKEKKPEEAAKVTPLLAIMELGEACSLYFDGAYQ